MIVMTGKVTFYMHNVLVVKKEKKNLVLHV